MPRSELPDTITTQQHSTSSAQCPTLHSITLPNEATHTHATTTTRANTTPCSNVNNVDGGWNDQSLKATSHSRHSGDASVLLLGAVWNSGRYSLGSPAAWTCGVPVLQYGTGFFLLTTVVWNSNSFLFPRLCCGMEPDSFTLLRYCSVELKLFALPQTELWYGTRIVYLTLDRAVVQNLNCSPYPGLCCDI